MVNTHSLQSRVQFRQLLKRALIIYLNNCSISRTERKYYSNKIFGTLNKDDDYYNQINRHYLHVTLYKIILRTIMIAVRITFI